MDRALIRMWQKSVGLNGNLAKWIGLKSGCGKKVWILMGTWQKCEGLNRNYARVLIRTWIGL